MTTPTTPAALAAAWGHFAEIKRRAPTSDVRMRILLGNVLDILAAQQEEITRLSIQLRERLPAAADSCPRCDRRDERACDATLPGPAPYAPHLPWLGAQQEPAPCG